MTKWISFLGKILILAIIFSIFTGCAVVSQSPDEDTVQFMDALGRQVSIPKKPRRVAALLGSFADIWVLAGGELCAAAEDAWTDFGLELPGAVNIGGAHSPNLELLFSSDPELVIASASTASNVQLKDTLEAAGIPVAYFDVDHFYDYLAMLDTLTDITGRKDLYAQNGLALQTQIEDIKAHTDLPEERRTVLLLRVHSGSVKAKGSEGTVLGEMLADLGCRNIADSDLSLLENLSVESILLQEPYRIFVVTMGNDTEKALKNLENMILENPAWNSLSAIREGRIYLMDRKLFNMKPNADWAESYEQLSNILLAEE